MKDMTPEIWNKYLLTNMEQSIEYTPQALKNSIDIHLQRVTSIDANDILDIGGGDGYAASVLQNLGKNVVSTSVSLEEVNYMRSQGVDARYEDMHNMSFDDNVFDCVYMRQVLEHAISPYMVFSEIYRVLKDDGYLILIVPPEIDITNTQHSFVYMHNASDKHYSVLTDIQLCTLWKKFDFTLEDIWLLSTINGQDKGYRLRCSKVVEGYYRILNGQIDDGNMKG